MDGMDGRDWTDREYGCNGSDRCDGTDGMDGRDGSDREYGCDGTDRTDGSGIDRHRSHRLDRSRGRDGTDGIHRSCLDGDRTDGTSWHGTDGSGGSDGKWRGCDPRRNRNHDSIQHGGNVGRVNELRL